MNFSQLKSPKYDELITNARAEGDAAMREGYLIDAEKFLVEEEMAVAPVYHYSGAFLMRPEIKGAIMNALGNRDYTRSYLEN